MKTIEKLMAAAFDEGARYKRCGNHDMGRVNNELSFYYFGNRIVCVNLRTKIFTTDDCGYTHSPSTHRAINDYTYHLQKRGYTLKEGSEKTC